MRTPEKQIYNESDTPYELQQFGGWYWDHETKEFYRWDNRPEINR